MKKFLLFFLIFLLVIGILLAYFLTRNNKGKTISLKEEMKIGENESDANQMFYNVSGVYTDFQNNFYIIDKGNFRIQIFDRNGKFIRTIGRKGEGPGELLSPTAVGVYNQELIFVGDEELRRVNVYDIDGKFLRSFKVEGSMSDLIVSGEDRIILAYVDGEGDLLHEFNFEGNLIRSFGRIKGQEWLNLFSDAVKICRDEEENIYVCFRYLNKIQKYNKDGNLIREVQANLPYKVQQPQRKGGGYFVRTVFFDIAYNKGNIYIITAPQGLLENILKQSNYIVMFNKELNQQGLSKLPYLSIALSFDPQNRILLCDIDFILHICNFKFPSGGYK